MWQHLRQHIWCLKSLCTTFHLCSMTPQDPRTGFDVSSWRSSSMKTVCVCPCFGLFTPLPSHQEALCSQRHGSEVVETHRGRCQGIRWWWRRCRGTKDWCGWFEWGWETSCGCPAASQTRLHRPSRCHVACWTRVLSKRNKMSGVLHKRKDTFFFYVCVTCTLGSSSRSVFTSRSPGGHLNPLWKRQHSVYWMMDGGVRTHPAHEQWWRPTASRHLRSQSSSSWGRTWCQHPPCRECHMWRLHTGPGYQTIFCMSASEVVRAEQAERDTLLW